MELEYLDSFSLWPMWDIQLGYAVNLQHMITFLFQLAYTFHGILIRNTTCSFNRSEEANDLLHLEFHLN